MKRRLIPILITAFCLIAGAGSTDASTNPTHSTATTATNSVSAASSAQAQIVLPDGGATGGTHCGDRRTTGNGGTKHFCKGESVDGAVISYRNPDGSWGKTFYACHLTHAARAGRVTSGVIRYFTAEVHTPKCADTQSSPGPRNPTGDGSWGSFQAGDYVLGFATEVNLGPDGRTYFNCLSKPAQASGRVNSGVVNPSRFEMSGRQRCNNTTNWNPGFRILSGDGGTIRFKAGDRIMAAYIHYDNGVERFNCFDRVADMDGSLTSGLRNFWPGDEANLAPC